MPSPSVTAVAESPPSPGPAPLIVAGRPGPRFRTRVGGPAPDAVPGPELGGATLDHLVDEVAALRGTADRKVAASLWMSQYASWTVGPVLAERARGRLLDAGLDVVSLTSRSGVIEAVTFRDAPRSGTGDTARDDDAVLTGLVDSNLAVVAARLRERTRVSSRALWGSIAAAFATGTRVLSWCAPTDSPLVDAPTAAAFARRLLRGRRLDRHCDLAEVAVDDRAWLVVHRGTCCLAHRTPTARYCATCPLLDPADRTRRLRETVLDHLRETR